MNNFSFSEKSLNRMSGVNWQIIEVAKLALSISSIDFGIPRHGGLRTAEEQQQLFNDKASQLDGTIKKSYHQSGMALDVFAYVDGKASWDECHLTIIAAAMLEAANRLSVNMRWGGHWANFKDMPHFEVR
jgi:peptidoglycan L-alanyl-D-glutamate endopeptidase CwlK